MAVRAKLRVVSVVPTAEGATYEGRTVKFNAVYYCNKTHATPEEEDACESHSYSKWTPDASLYMQITNPRAFEQFHEGDVSYLDFTRASAE